MPSLHTLAAKFRWPFAAAGHCQTFPPRDVPTQPLLVLRGVSRQGTIRAEAARVIAVTALHFGTQQRR